VLKGRMCARVSRILGRCSLDMEPPHGMLKISQTPQGLYGCMA
jgi:hypothetical protein